MSTPSGKSPKYHFRVGGVKRRWHIDLYENGKWVTIGRSKYFWLFRARNICTMQNIASHEIERAKYLKALRTKKGKR